MEIKNEQGGVMVIVLMVIIIFSLLGLTLIFLNDTRSKNVAISEESILATNMAEVGIKNAEHVIRDTLINNKYDDSWNLEPKIKSKIKEHFDYKIDENFSFSYKIDWVKTPSSQELSLLLISVGQYIDKKSEIHTQFDITKTLVPSLFPEEKGKVINGRIGKIKETWDGGRYLKGNLHLRPPSELIVKGDLYITGSLQQDANTNLLVSGNAHIKEPKVKENSGNKGNLGFFCTEGTLFYYKSINDVNVLQSGESCEKLNKRKPPANGIYAKKFEIIDTSKEEKIPFWEESKLLINTEYK